MHDLGGAFCQILTVTGVRLQNARTDLLQHPQPLSLSRGLAEGGAVGLKRWSFSCVM
jgi:hypothetical protein